MSKQEGKVLLALQAIQKGQIKSLRAAARLFSVPESTLRSRAHGIQSRVDTRPNGHKLTQLEEDSLIEWIISMDSRGAAPRPATVRDMANILLAARGSHPPPTVSKNWPSTFINRREEIRTRVSRRYDYHRALNEDPKSIQAWFTTVQQVIDKNGIQPEDIYNFDETGFAMGLISTQTVVTRQEYYGRRAILQPGNREWVTAIEAICVDGYSLPPCVIFKGKVAIASWFDNLPKDWRFEVSANGWTTDDIGLRWLEKLFIPSTNSRVRGRFRLLILDGHGSHLTPQFDRICSENNIIPLCMPPHSSHLLQPLDVGCFSVLKITYGRFISDLARTGYNHIDKLDFLADFQRARLEAFKPATIQNSFIATGLVPIDAEKVLSKLNISLRTPTPPGTRPGSRSSQFSPKTPRTVVQLQKQASMLKDLLRQRSNSPPSPSKLMLDQIIKGHCISLHNTALLAQENANLRAANEKKRQKRSRSTRQVPCEQGLTVEEGLQLLTQLELPVEAPAVEPHTQVELPIQPNQPAPRAQPRCSGCREVGHRINFQSDIYRICNTVMFKRSFTSKSFTSKSRAGKTAKASKKKYDEQAKEKMQEKVEKVDHPPTGSALTSPIITMVVGQEQRLFAAHEDVLSISPYFRTALKEKVMDDDAKQLALPDEEPEVLSCILEFLYKGDYYPRLFRGKRRDSWHLENAQDPQQTGGCGSSEPTMFHSGVGDVVLRDTVVYCAAERYGLDELKQLALRKQGLQTGIPADVILRSARYAYDNTPDTESRLRAHYLALIIRSRKTFKRSGTMQMEMENGGKLFFDLFVAMCNHMDDLAEIR
ncbi:uncharacterized protein N7483_000488 [Penicillium malachiteum]|uniref:uncharacterized protein n=1 Tax=Penicillium malachiteum TaxID=1324776 RepID=UPI00254760DD|nr:uncharacterized protein N7483_000488 [Penicillium malachiteum]KAJ5735363.1 hypothetical protein N7483_000488 [Penicillium malachiteum]